MIDFFTIEEKPPTLFSILQAFSNKKNINELIDEARGHIFDFDYDFYDENEKIKFEKLFLKKFIMRRIAFETLTMFKLQLEVKLNEIMLKYNKMIEGFKTWNIMNDGEIITNTSNNVRESQTLNKSNSITNSTMNNINESKSSDTPQNKIENVKDGKYVSDYSYITNSNTSNDNSISNNLTSNNDKSTLTNKQIKTQNDKMGIYKQMQNEINSIYTLIFNDLNDLFYQVY